MSEESKTSAPSAAAPAKKKAAPPRKKPAPAKTEQPAAATKTTAKESAPINDGDPTERTRKELATEKKVTVVINSTAEDKDDVFVALNGFAFTIQRDKEVQIPFSVYQVLMDAKSTVYRQVKREDGEGMQMVETEIQRFSMSARF
jgi:hypothetical protein